MLSLTSLADPLTSNFLDFAKRRLLRHRQSFTIDGAGSRVWKAAGRCGLICVWLAAAAPPDVRAATVLYSCEVTRLIVASGKTSSTRHLTVQIELNENDSRLKFDDETRWGPTEIDVLNAHRIAGSSGPLQFSLDRRSGRLSRYLGGGGRSLLDTGLCK